MKPEHTYGTPLLKEGVRVLVGRAPFFCFLFVSIAKQVRRAFYELVSNIFCAYLQNSLHLSWEFPDILCTLCVGIAFAKSLTKDSSITNLTQATQKQLCKTF